MVDAGVQFAYHLCPDIIDIEPDKCQRLASGLRVPPVLSLEDLASSSSSGLDSKGEIRASISVGDACDDRVDPALHSNRDVIPYRYDVKRRKTKVTV